MGKEIYPHEKRERNLKMIRDMRAKVSIVQLVNNYGVNHSRMREIERNYIRRGIVKPR